MTFLLMKGPAMPLTTSAPPGAFDLDVRVVTGPDAAAAQLLSITDDGCDTLATGDC
jgi:FxLD family lantipeptide